MSCFRLFSANIYKNFDWIFSFQLSTISYFNHVFRCANGVGSALVHNSGLPLATGLFPGKSAMITALIHCSNGLGVLLGPLLGSLIYSVGGYQWIFISTGLFGASTLIFSFLIIPEHVDFSFTKSKIQPGKIFKFIFTPRVLMFLIPNTILVSTSGFKNSAFSVYYKDYLNISDELSGYMFLPFAIGFFIAAPAYGLLTKLGYGCLIEICAQFLTCFILFCFYIPQIVPYFENIYYILTILFVYGTLQSSVYNPQYLIMEKLALSLGYKNIAEIRTLSTSSFGLFTAFSRSFGATLFGGYVNEWVGYYNTCLCYACLLLFTSIWMLLFLVSQGLAKSGVFYSSGDGLISMNCSANLDKDSSKSNEDKMETNFNWLLFFKVDISYDAYHLYQTQTCQFKIK